MWRACVQGPHARAKCGDHDRYLEGMCRSMRRGYEKRTRQMGPMKRPVL